MEKQQILQQGLKQLNNYAGNLFSVAMVGSDNYDAVRINDDQSGGFYTGFVQPWAPQKDINALLAQLKSMPANAILFADFVNPVMAEKFRKRSISYIDCAGNIFLKDERYSFSVKGRKPSNLRNKRVRGRAFNSAGLKLIFALFNRPQLLHASYREISTTVNIALGSIGPVMEDLFSSGYILDDGQRRLVNKQRLFERWVDGYLEKLRPKQIMSCYSSENVNWWKTAEPAGFGGRWGGEVVVARKTPFMVPETISLYFPSHENVHDFAYSYGLDSDDQGDICVYKNFWSDQVYSNGGISPMIMYADIVDSINPGAWDVAKTFYGETVADLLRD